MQQPVCPWAGIREHFLNGSTHSFVAGIVQDLRSGLSKSSKDVEQRLLLICFTGVCASASVVRSAQATLVSSQMFSLTRRSLPQNLSTSCWIASGSMLLQPPTP
jgi:hypothetical protein